MSEEWLEKMIEKGGPHLSPTFFRVFLIEEHLISVIDQAEKRIKIMLARIEHLPQGYQRLMEVFFQERIALRERQIKLHAKKPLAVSTIESDFGMLARLVRWLTVNVPDLTGWEMIQEEHIHAFLLTLKPITREVVRKDLYIFFRLGRKRRIITHVPILNFPQRKLPPTVEPLKVQEQKALARHIQESAFSHSEEALLSALCFYHGLSPVHLCRIKTHDVDIERAMIHVGERPPVYLLAEDFLLLEQFLRKRQDLPYASSRSYLFISNQKKLADDPVGKAYVKYKLLAFTGFTPPRLRITCFAALSARYGSQYLVEAFGLSLPQAARYGNLEKFLLQEEVKQQREEFLELSRQLGQSGKQHASQSHSKKAEVKHGDTV